MVYYEPRVTQADKDHITHRLSKYVMDIRHDHELYRHLHCYWPDDPIGPNNCSFDVITHVRSCSILQKARANEAIPSHTEAYDYV